MQNIQWGKTIRMYDREKTSKEKQLKVNLP